jgi:hypothetical protein
MSNEWSVVRLALVDLGAADSPADPAERNIDRRLVRVLPALLYKPLIGGHRTLAAGLLQARW